MKLKVSEPHSIDYDLVSPYIYGRLKTPSTPISDEVVLINTVPADTQSRDEHSIPERTRASRKKNFDWDSLFENPEYTGVQSAATSFLLR